MFTLGTHTSKYRCQVSIFLKKSMKIVDASQLAFSNLDFNTIIGKCVKNIRFSY